MRRCSLSVLPLFVVWHRHTLVECVVATRDDHGIGLTLARTPLLACSCVFSLPCVCRMVVCSLQNKTAIMPNRFGHLPPMSDLLSIADVVAGGQPPQAPSSGMAQSAAVPAGATRPPYSATPRPLYVQRPEPGPASVLASSRPSTDLQSEHRLYDGGLVSPDSPAPAKVDHADPV